MSFTDAHRRRYFCLILQLCLALLLLTYYMSRNARSDPLPFSHSVARSPIPKQARSNLKLPVHPSLYSYGRIIVYHSGMYPHGGSGALNYLHCALVTAGFNAFMHIPNSMSIAVKCSRYIADDFDVSANDIVIIPEGAYFNRVPAWRSAGGRIVDYMLGLNAPLAEQYHTNVIWAPSSTYTRDLYLATGKQVLFSPIENYMYDVHRKDMAAVNGTANTTNIYRDLKMKENLIVLDGDCNFPSSVQTMLERLPVQPPVTFQILRNIAFENVPSWLKRAKLVIDLGIAGVERVNNEGALFDAIVLVGMSLNGMDPTDFPIPDQFKLDTRNELQMFEVVKSK